MKHRAVLNGLVALSVVGAFYTFAFCMVDDIEDPMISEEYRYSTDTVPVEMQYAQVSPSKEALEEPDEDEESVVQEKLETDVSYEAVSDFFDPYELLVSPLLTEQTEQVTSVAANDEPEAAQTAVAETEAAAETQPAETTAPEDNGEEPVEITVSYDYLGDDIPEDIYPDSDSIDVVQAAAAVDDDDDSYFSAYDEAAIRAEFEALLAAQTTTVPDTYAVESDFVDYTVAHYVPTAAETAETTAADTSAFSDPYTEWTANTYYDTTVVTTVDITSEESVGTDITSYEDGVEMFTARYNGQVNEIDAYTLTCMIVENEMSPYFNREALKAQAVAAYSYVKYHNVNGLVPTVLVKTDISSEVKAAVDEVFRKCCYYNGEVAQTVYTASTAGRSADAESVWGGYAPYLQSVDTSFDAENDPNYGVVSQFSEEYIRSALESYLGVTLSDNPENWLMVTGKTDGLYVSELNVDGQAVISGRAMRENVLSYGIRSWAFDVSYADGIFTFITYGYGHGVGMSQNGANYLAGQGYTYDQILTYYFTGINVE